MMDRNELIIQLRGLAEKRSAPFLNPDEKKLAHTIYRQVFGRDFTPTNCRDCYMDKVIEAYIYLKKGGKMEAEKQYILKRGYLLFWKNDVYTCKTLPDFTAAEYLEAHPEHESWFEKLPAKAETTEKTEKATTEGGGKKARILKTPERKAPAEKTETAEEAPKGRKAKK